MPNFNSGSLIPILKTNTYDSIDNYMPITMANFKFKIISKILADRLSAIHPMLNRGVRQGDPLSPLLFCIAEDVLSRAISEIVLDGHIKLFKGANSTTIPFHYFFADDLMVYCNGRQSTLTALRNVFSRYASCSGQFFNVDKSIVFASFISHAKLHRMTLQVGFRIDILPFWYLGIPIFRGKPK